MDIDKHLSDEEDDYEEAQADDDDERKAPSEHDIDGTNNKGKSDHMDIQSDKGGSIHSQSIPFEFNLSPLQAKVHDFESSLEPQHLASFEEHHPTEEQDHEDDNKGEPDDGYEGDYEDDHKDDCEDDHESDREAERDADHYDDREDIDVEDEDSQEDSLKSSSSKHIGEDLPQPSPSKPSASTRNKHVSSRSFPKDQQSTRHKHKVKEPMITKSLLEDKIVGILSKILPQMLLGLFQEAMGQAKVLPSEQAPRMTSSVKVTNSARPKNPLNRVDHATQEVGVQGMDVDRMDKSTHMDATTLPVDSPTTANANVSNHCKCLSILR